MTVNTARFESNPSSIERDDALTQQLDAERSSTAGSGQGLSGDHDLQLGLVGVLRAHAPAMRVSSAASVSKKTSGARVFRHDALLFFSSSR